MLCQIRSAGYFNCFTRVVKDFESLILFEFVEDLDRHTLSTPCYLPDRLQPYNKVF